MCAAMTVDKLQELLKKAERQGAYLVKVDAGASLSILDKNLDELGVVDFKNECLSEVSVSPRRTIEVSHSDRTTGEYSFVFRERVFKCGSQKELLNKALSVLGLEVPGLLDELTKIKPRSKRIVARDKNDLFERVELAEQYSEPLIPGWWIGTNNSWQEATRWLERACEVGGVQFEGEFRILSPRP